MTHYLVNRDCTRAFSNCHAELVSSWT